MATIIESGKAFFLLLFLRLFVYSSVFWLDCDKSLCLLKAEGYRFLIYNLFLVGHFFCSNTLQNGRFTLFTRDILFWGTLSVGHTLWDTFFKICFLQFVSISIFFQGSCDGHPGGQAPAQALPLPQLRVRRRTISRAPDCLRQCVGGRSAPAKAARL